MAVRRKTTLLGAVALTVGLVIVAFIAGGSSPSPHSGSTKAGAAIMRSQPVRGGPLQSATSNSGSSAVAAGVRAAPEEDSLAVPRARSSEADSSAALTAVDVEASRIVKSGGLDLTEPKGKVPTTIERLTALAIAMGGYVQSSQTDDTAAYPSGSLTLRVPTGRFEDTVTQAERLGKVNSLTTSGQDVTGKYVDLQARLTALRHTRSTYLTILSHATTIASTLDVQQRVDDVQSRIEQLQGQLKVLRNQSSDATLAVTVEQQGAPAPAKRADSGGIGQAWHRSVDRFARGFDAIVAALGPIVLAVLIVAALLLAGRVGIRIARRTMPTP